MKRNIIREIPPAQTDFSRYFDGDCFTSSGQDDYCHNLFIVAHTRNSVGFNETEYNYILENIAARAQEYYDMRSGSNYTVFSSVEDLLTEFFEKCWDQGGSLSEELVAEYLTLTTGKEWAVDIARGYCQGDIVSVVYCKERHPDAKQYGEIWLGAATEFEVIKLDEDGEEIDSCFGYIVADCLAWKDEDYKRLVCDWAGLDLEQTKLERIIGEKHFTKYEYKEVC